MLRYYWKLQFPKGNALPIILFSIFIFLLIGCATGLNQKWYSSNNKILDQQLEKNEAIIWYLGHSGWAVKTKAHLMVFDCVRGQEFIDFSKFPKHDVFIFTSHSHSDHYDRSIFKWEKQVEDINYIFGWKVGDRPNYHYMEGRMAKKIKDVSISSIEVI